MTTSSPYDDGFFRARDPGSRRSAEAILPLVLDVLRPRSVIDVGCGTGVWLNVCRSLGVEDVLGIDGPYVDPRTLAIPEHLFLGRDLNAPLDVGRRFDLAMSLEVAEHLQPESAKAFVDGLTTCAPAVLFSAAVPLQPGQDHVNCQWPDYWAELFRSRGFLAVDSIRPATWEDDAVDWWYAQNTVLYLSEELLEGDERLALRFGATSERPRRLVHPGLHLYLDELHSAALREARRPGALLSHYAWRLRGLARRLASRR